MVAPAARDQNMSLGSTTRRAVVVHRPGAAFERDICIRFCEAEQKPRRPEG